MTYLNSSKSSKKGYFSLMAKRAKSRTMMFGVLLSFLITGASCKVNEELAQKRKQKRIENRRFADSVYLAQKHNYLIELQGENFPQSQDQEIDH